MSTVEHFLYTPTEAQAQAMAAELQITSGLPVDDVRRAASGPDWLVVAYTGEDFDPEAFAALAARHGGHYDGWGTYVGPLPTLAPPPPVERRWSAASWSGREIAVAFGVILALVPILSTLERVIGASAGVLAAVYWAATVAAYVAMRAGRGGAALFAVYITGAVRAVEATAEVLDVWQGWVALVVIGPVLAVQWLRGRRRTRDEVSV